MTFEIEKTSETEARLTRINAEDILEDTIVIPEKVDGYIITSLGRCFAKNIKAKKLVMSNQVKLLENGAFIDSRLKEIVIPSSISEIPQKCFYHASVEKVTFEDPSGVKHIGHSAFKGTIGLTELIWPSGCDSIPKQCFSRSKIKHLFNTENITTIREAAFYSSDLQEFTVPKSVTSIPFGAFECSDIHSLTFEAPEKIIYIGGSAFYATLKLEDFVWPSGCQTIPYACFKYSGINSISGLEAVTIIEKEAFAGTDHLKTIIWPSKCKTIPMECFAHSGLKEISNTEHVTTVETAAFCLTDISEITLFNVSTIGTSCFENSKLRKTIIKCPDSSSMKINPRAFSGTNLLDSIDWPAGCEEIPDGCFSLSGLSKITGIENVVKIGCSAFKSTKLTSIAIPCKCEKIPSDCFAKTKQLDSVIIDSSSIKFDVKAFDGSSIKEIDVTACETVQVSALDWQDLVPKMKLDFDTRIFSR